MEIQVCQYNASFHFNRIIDVIDSCLTFEQLETSIKLIFNSKKKFGHDFDSKFLLDRIKLQKDNIYHQRIKKMKGGV